MDEKEIIKKVAFNIKVTRLQRGLTQFQLAEMIDVHEKYIGRVESGKQNITIIPTIPVAMAMTVQSFGLPTARSIMFIVSKETSAISASFN